jgi:hypothetical protein
LGVNIIVELCGEFLIAFMLLLRVQTHKNERNFTCQYYWYEALR